jgi:hypothetical protein
VQRKVPIRGEQHVTTTITLYRLMRFTGESRLMSVWLIMVAAATGSTREAVIAYVDFNTERMNT